MTSYVQDGTVGEWAEEKLSCLQEYLRIYSTVLNTQKWCSYYFVDGFSGSGRAKLRAKKYKENPNHSVPLFSDDCFPEVPLSEEEGKYIEGSPRRALSTKPPFNGYLFIEKNQKCVNKLQSLRDEFPDQDILIEQGDVNEILLNWIKSKNWTKSKAVVFLDPFGMQLLWSTIEALAKTGSIEVIINNTIPMAVQRLLPRNGKITDSQRIKLNGYFGTSEWEQIIYEEHIDLFGEAYTNKLGKSSEQLCKFYVERLKNIFGYTAPPRIVRNTKNVPIYYINWAGPHKKGKEIISYIMRQGDTL